MITSGILWILYGMASYRYEPVWVLSHECHENNNLLTDHPKIHSLVSLWPHYRQKFLPTVNVNMEQESCKVEKTTGKTGASVDQRYNTYTQIYMYIYTSISFQGNHSPLPTKIARFPAPPVLVPWFLACGSTLFVCFRLHLLWHILLAVWSPLDSWKKPCE